MPATCSNNAVSLTAVYDRGTLGKPLPWDLLNCSQAAHIIAKYMWATASHCDSTMWHEPPSCQASASCQVDTLHIEVPSCTNRQHRCIMYSCSIRRGFSLSNFSCAEPVAQGTHNVKLCRETCCTFEALPCSLVRRINSTTCYILEWLHCKLVRHAPV